jgi:succinoglycan biosynthesis protein ExoM
MSTSPGRPTIAVAICTYQRNDMLTVLLKRLVECAAHLGSQAAVGVVLVDDSNDGQAEVVANAFAGRFELGLAYRRSGKQNISLARNLAIETACGMADWTAMTDDDCEPMVGWLSALLDTQAATGADAVTGTMVRRVPAGSPRWLTEEPFLSLGQSSPPDGSELTVAATFNSMISSRWLKDHPDNRFQPSLGVIGGEDMVFFRAAHAAGLRIRFSEKAVVHEDEPAARANLPYQLRLFLWHGNSSYVTSSLNGIAPRKLFLHGAKSLALALVYPIGRLARGQRPQLRYSAALTLHALGKLAGPLGVRIDHK